MTTLCRHCEKNCDDILTGKDDADDDTTGNFHLETRQSLFSIAASWYETNDITNWFIIDLTPDSNLVIADT